MKCLSPVESISHHNVLSCSLSSFRFWRFRIFNFVFILNIITCLILENIPFIDPYLNSHSTEGLRNQRSQKSSFGVLNVLEAPPKLDSRVESGQFYQGTLLKFNGHGCEFQDKEILLARTDTGVTERFEFWASKITSIIHMWHWVRRWLFELSQDNPPPYLFSCPGFILSAALVLKILTVGSVRWLLNP